MEKSKFNLRFGVLCLIIVFAAFSRLIPHPPNFTPIGATALFGAAYFVKKYVALIIPVLSLWLSDLVINNVLYALYFKGFVLFYPGFYWIYSAFILIVVSGFFLLRKKRLHNIIIASLVASVMFFLISNFGVWVSGTLYPKDQGGLLACYMAAIPFFRNTVMGDIFYCGIMFGAFELAQYKIPALKLKSI